MPIFAKYSKGVDGWWEGHGRVEWEWQKIPRNCPEKPLEKIKSPEQYSYNVVTTQLSPMHITIAEGMYISCQCYPFGELHGHHYVIPTFTWC